MREFILFVLLAICAPLTLIFGLAWGLMSWECSNYEGATGKPTKVAGLACYVQEGGVWMHWDEYKLRFATHGAGKE